MMRWNNPEWLSRSWRSVARFSLESPRPSQKLSGRRVGEAAQAGLLLAAALMPGAPASAAAGDWPCVQVRVETLSAATFWPEPPLEGAAATSGWRARPEIAELVAHLVSRRNSIEDAEKRIAAFATARKGDKEAMALVFAGTFFELNALRTQIVHGIERFNRNQRQLADDLNKARAELTSLTDAPGEKTEQQRTRIQELQTKVQWDTRLHNERKNTLRYVCETPGLLEQRIFAIARAVQNEM